MTSRYATRARQHARSACKPSVVNFQHEEQGHRGRVDVDDEQIVPAPCQDGNGVAVTQRGGDRGGALTSALSPLLCRWPRLRAMRSGTGCQGASRQIMTCKPSRARDATVVARPGHCAGGHTFFFTGCPAAVTVSMKQ